MSSSINLSLTDELRSFVNENGGDGSLYATPSRFFSGNTGTTGAFHASARFRFGESSDNDRERLRKS